MKPITCENSTNSPQSDDAHRTTVYDCALVELPRIKNRAGNITVLEDGKNCPFPMPRVFYLYDIPGGTSRGGHAHRQQHQLLVGASGSFDVTIDDGRNRRTVQLNRPYYALHIPPGIWAEEHNFSSGSICLVLASDRYNESDYLRDHVEYRQWKR